MENIGHFSLSQTYYHLLSKEVGSLRILNPSIQFIIILLLILLAVASNVKASGFAIGCFGAKELAIQDKVIAHSEGPTSIYANPALLSEIPGTHMELGVCALIPTMEFKSSQTGRSEKKDQTLFLGTLVMTHQVNDRFTVGLAIVNPFGLRTDWGKTWEGRYLATNSKMQTYNINPNISWKLSNKLSIAVGIDYLLLDVTLERNINFSLLGLPDGEQKYEGDGDGLGYNFGFVYHINQDWSFGASYRSKIKVDIDGDTKFKLPPGSPPFLGAVFPNTRGFSEIELPPQAFFGLCCKAIDHITLEIGALWEGWSSLEELAFNFDQPIVESSSLVFKKNWDDVWSYGVGGKYQLNDSLAILSGFHFENNPIPDDTFEPAIPSSDKWSASLGLKKNFGNLFAGIVYDYEKYEDREKNNALGAELGGTANGEYKSDIHILSVSISYEF